MPLNFILFSILHRRGQHCAEHFEKHFALEPLVPHCPRYVICLICVVFELHLSCVCPMVDSVCRSCLWTVGAGLLAGSLKFEFWIWTCFLLLILWNMLLVDVIIYWFVCILSRDGVFCWWLIFHNYFLYLFLSDTLNCYPFLNRDPFVIKDVPSVLFAGNQVSVSCCLQWCVVSYEWLLRPFCDQRRSFCIVCWQSGLICILVDVVHIFSFVFDKDCIRLSFCERA